MRLNEFILKNFTDSLDKRQSTHGNWNWEGTNVTQAGGSGWKYPFYQKNRYKQCDQFNPGSTDLDTFWMDRKGHEGVTNPAGISETARPWRPLGPRDRHDWSLFVAGDPVEYFHYIIQSWNISWIELNHLFHSPASRSCKPTDTTQDFSANLLEIICLVRN